MSATVELWERRKVAGKDTEFRWMVWQPEHGSIDGECHWFIAEQDARELFERLSKETGAAA